MKYAFITLIAIYLVIYGCSPDNSEKATESHEKTAPAAVQTPPQSEMVAVPEQQVKPTAPILEVQHPEADAEKRDVVTQHPAIVAETAEQAPAVDQKQTAEVIQKQQAVNKPQPPTEMTESQQIILPCGRTMAKEDFPENAPCLAQPQTSQDTVDKERELTATLQKMMETTNSMVLATKQLVIATHEMLNAGKEVSTEGTDKTKELMETKKENKPVEQSVEGQQPAKTSKKDVIKTMQEVVSAAQELIEATNKTISVALEPEQI